MTGRGYALDELLRQSGALAGDLRTLHDDTRARARRIAARWGGVSHVYLTGNGDSYHAALATEMAFQTLGGLRCQALSALRLLEYGAVRGPGTAVIAISASGGNERAVQALRRAADHGARTLAITATAGSPLTTAADDALVMPLTGLRPCPGIRTYQAGLLGLLSVAVELGGVSGGELPAVADAIEATAEAVRPRCEGLAERVAGAPVLMMLGTGPGYGSARFAAAKVIETAGTYAAGQDLEEWEHVDALALPRDMPTFVIAGAGRSRRRALAVAARAAGLGRTVVAVADAGDREMAEAADVTLPLHGAVREEFSPLVSHVFAGFLAYEIAHRLGRRPFSTH